LCVGCGSFSAGFGEVEEGFEEVEHFLIGIRIMEKYYFLQSV
jgi:hypothetical protein